MGVTNNHPHGMLCWCTNMLSNKGNNMPCCQGPSQDGDTKSLIQHVQPWAWWLPCSVIDVDSRVARQLPDMTADNPLTWWSSCSVIDVDCHVPWHDGRQPLAMMAAMFNSKCRLSCSMTSPWHEGRQFLGMMVVMFTNRCGRRSWKVCRSI